MTTAIEIAITMKIGENEVGVGLGEGVKGTFAGTEIICGLLKSLCVSEKK